ncbi:uracil-DNA glycosylase [Geomonas sp. RF6]|uniref:uracil-DNA glycosylase family protein n=1 Tax=Geomonas sp. RF6 TaxID=2897342 RepID=UPI001E29F143|nr:uracil-DNA glycosylase family protein [Geomonas sp. RF6]UFS71258.1 uracil-DNA glycosylase [Geomonas sp. RF6]
MVELAEQELLVASLRGYLEELLESGVTELAFGGESASPPAASPVAASPAAAPAAESPVAPLYQAFGDPAARLVLVMTGDGYRGDAGELLAKMVQAMGFAIEEVYLLTFDPANPPSRSSLLEVLHTVEPEAVMTLGEDAAQILAGSDVSLADLRGSFSALEGAPLMPTWHPEVLLNNQALKREAWNDMQQVMHRLGKSRRA